MSYSQPYASAVYQAFTSAWRTGSIDSQALQGAIDQTDDLDEQVIALRLSYAVRRGWLRLQDAAPNSLDRG